jgi:hypothetical protein
MRPTPFPAAGTELPPPPPEGRRAKTLVIAAALVLLVGAAGVAVALVASGDDPKPSARSSPAPAPSPSLFQPIGLRTAATAFTVTLTWFQPNGGTAVEGYNIYRNQAYIAAVAAANTSYTDENALPGHTYTYEVEATGSGLESGRTPVKVKTKIPSLSEARVEGDYNVVVKVVSAHGFQSYSGKFTIGWHFKPKCKKGTCDVMWSDLTEDTLTGLLTRKSASYHGGDTGKFNSTCGQTVVLTTLTIDFHVTHAKPRFGEWRASKFEGTMTQREDSQLGCVASSADLTIVGTLL